MKLVAFIPLFQVEIEVFFQYFLRKDDLPYLHKFYDLVYDPTIRSSAIAALKVSLAIRKYFNFLQRFVKKLIVQSAKSELFGTKENVHFIQGSF